MQIPRGRSSPRTRRAPPMNGVSPAASSAAGPVANMVRTADRSSRWCPISPGRCGPPRGARSRRLLLPASEVPVEDRGRLQPPRGKRKRRAGGTRPLRRRPVAVTPAHRPPVDDVWPWRASHPRARRTSAARGTDASRSGAHARRAKRWACGGSSGCWPAARQRSSVPVQDPQDRERPPRECAHPRARVSGLEVLVRGSCGPFG